MSAVAAAVAAVVAGYGKTGEVKLPSAERSGRNGMERMSRVCLSVKSQHQPSR